MTTIRYRLVLVILLLLCCTGPVAAQGQAAIEIMPQNLTTLNQSVTIATGNTFQQVLAASPLSTSNLLPSRRSITIQNNNAADSCWIAFGDFNFGAGNVPITAANATKAISILLTAGGSFQRYSPFVPSDAIIATCATTSDTLYIDTQ